jgi:carbonic anhydrase/acetyltransferase-like protein (isoleucine patch superfamily)
MIIPFHGQAPRVAPDAFIAPTAVVIGNVEIGAGASVWFGAVLRGDHGRIVVGAGSNVQDNATLHAPEGGETVLEDEVSVGHGAVLEGCVVRRGALIGINAVVLHGVTIGERAMVAAGAVVPEGMAVPPETLAAGVPARVKKALDGSALGWVNRAAGVYRELAQEFRRETEGVKSEE